MGLISHDIQGIRNYYDCDTRGILHYLLSRSDKWKTNKQDLYNRSKKDGDKSLDSGVAELKNNGYLTIQKCLNEDNKIVYHHRLLPNL